MPFLFILDSLTPQQRHSHPDFGDGNYHQQQSQRPLSEAGSEQHYENGAPDRTSSTVSPGGQSIRGGAGAGGDKPSSKSTNDIYATTGSHSVAVQEMYRSSGGVNNTGLSNNNPDLVQDSVSSHRHSGVSTHSGDSGSSNMQNGSGRNSNTDSLSRLVSGGRRNLPKVQRPLTR